MPLPRTVEQSLGIGQIERRIASVGCYHRARPRVLKLNAALRVMETDSRRVACDVNGFYTQIGHTPHFVEHHFGVGRIRYLLHGLGRNPNHTLCLIYATNAIHLLKIGHIACTHCLPAANPQLSKVQGTTVERRYVGHPQAALFPPTGQGYPATDGRSVFPPNDGGRKSRTTVLRTYEQRLI